jgi:hypothetical protein
MNDYLEAERMRYIRDEIPLEGSIYSSDRSMKRLDNLFDILTLKEERDWGIKPPANFINQRTKK